MTTLRFASVAGLLLLTIVACSKSSEPEKPGATVAIYSDDGVWNDSRIALKNMFKWMEYSVAEVSADYINTHGLSKYSLFCVPGGNMYLYAGSLSWNGKDSIRSFIRRGGAYMGICGGAYFASKRVTWRDTTLNLSPLGIFNGASSGPIDKICPYPGYIMCKINIADTAHPITRLEPDTSWMLYYWGPALIPEQDSTITILGRYDISNVPVAVAVQYGSGRVFLIGTHPEIEENGDRDSVTFGSGLDDRGSDWELMKQATAWCLKK